MAKTTSRKPRRPVSPGLILDTEFLQPLGLTQKQLADHIGVDVKTINRVVNGRCAVTPELALLLARALKTPPMFWLTLQCVLDLYDVGLELERGPKPLVDVLSRAGRRDPVV